MKKLYFTLEEKREAKKAYRETRNKVRASQRLAKPMCTRCGKVQIPKYQRKYCKSCAYIIRHNIGDNYNSVREDKNYGWKGDNVGYCSVHIWVRKHKVKPLLCEECHKVPPRELANISGKYLRDINDYRYLCIKCHRREDYANGRHGGKELCLQRSRGDIQQLVPVLTKDGQLVKIT